MLLHFYERYEVMSDLYTTYVNLEAITHNFGSTGTCDMDRVHCSKILMPHFLHKLKYHAREKLWQNFMFLQCL
jgi:hypothetical protein